PNFAPNSTPPTPITQTVGRASTSMTVSSTGSGHTVYDHDVTFTATVTSVPPGSGTPTGQVRFVIDGLAQTPVAVDSTGKATIVVSGLGVGNHTAGGDYLGVPPPGPSNFAPFSTPTVITHVINKANTTTTVTAPVNKSGFGDS